MASLDNKRWFSLPTIARLLRATTRFIREELSLARALMPQRLPEREQRLAALDHAIAEATKREELAEFILERLPAETPSDNEGGANGSGRTEELR